MANEHDKRYKKLFSNHKLVEELLTSFVDEDFVKELDYSTLERLDKSFVTDEFADKESDLIYKVNFKGEEIYIYLLLEFQSTVDRFMAYSPGSIELFNRNIDSNPLPRQHTVEFIHENTYFFKNVFDNYAKLPKAGKIKIVMVLELSLIPEWAGYYAAESLVNYHFNKAWLTQLIDTALGDRVKLMDDDQDL